MSVAVALAVGTVYGLYTFGALGSPHTKYCVANQIDYHPYLYSDQEDMVNFLAKKGSENVTSKFDSVILFGFISNTLFVLFQIYKMGQNMRKKDGVSKRLVLGEVVIAGVWITQLFLLVKYRFSHTGKVCAGDYAELELMSDSPYLTDDKYVEYYLKDEGDFLYYYIMAILIFGGVVLALACLVGSCLFMGGSFTALKMIEDLLKNLDNLPEMMRRGAGGQPGDGYQR